MHAILAPAAPIAGSPVAPTVEDLVENVDNLLSLPDAVIRLNSLLMDPDASTNEIADVIRMDPALSARVLRAVNSAYFGLRGRVDTISKAISMIGTSELHSLVLATSAAQAFKGISHKLIDMEAFWQHSVRAALAARRLGEAGMGRRRESLFLAGLLHDVGRLVLFHELPAVATRILAAVQGGEPYDAAEHAMLGFSHAEVGAALLSRWNLPASLTDPVRYHHEFAEATDHAMESALVHLGSAVSDLMERDLPPGEEPVLDVTPEAWEQAGCAPDELAEVITDVSMHWLQVIEIVAPGSVLV